MTLRDIDLASRDRDLIALVAMSHGTFSKCTKRSDQHINKHIKNDLTKW